MLATSNKQTATNNVFDTREETVEPVSNGSPSEWHQSAAVNSCYINTMECTRCSEQWKKVGHWPQGMPGAHAALQLWCKCV